MIHSFCSISSKMYILLSNLMRKRKVSIWTVGVGVAVVTKIRQTAMNKGGWNWPEMLTHPHPIFVVVSVENEIIIIPFPLGELIKVLCLYVFRNNASHVFCHFCKILPDSGDAIKLKTAISR